MKVFADYSQRFPEFFGSNSVGKGWGKPDVRDRLLPCKVFQPEGLVGFEEVVALVAVVAMHAVGVDHEVEFLA